MFPELKLSALIALARVQSRFGGLHVSAGELHLPRPASVTKEVERGCNGNRKTVQLKDSQ